MPKNKTEYTRIRRFYAWTGFVVWLIVGMALAVGFGYFLMFVISHASEIF